MTTEFRRNINEIIADHKEDVDDEQFEEDSCDASFDRTVFPTRSFIVYINTS